jgi:hypothetical protein
MRIRDEKGAIINTADTQRTIRDYVENYSSIN